MLPAGAASSDVVDVSMAELTGNKRGDATLGVPRPTNHKPCDQHRPHSVKFYCAEEDLGQLHRDG